MLTTLRFFSLALLAFCLLDVGRASDPQGEYKFKHLTAHDDDGGLGLSNVVGQKIGRLSANPVVAVSGKVAGKVGRFANKVTGNHVTGKTMAKIKGGISQSSAGQHLRSGYHFGRGSKQAEYGAKLQAQGFYET